MATLWVALVVLVSLLFLWYCWRTKDGPQYVDNADELEDALDRAYQARDDWKQETERLREELEASHVPRS